MRVIVTAGHVDHGKSTLVKALTGINPDRLAEEQARQMTIDLGFAWLQLPDGETVGIVDVPGHEDFIENMLAGVGGVDLGVLVIAADEGVMPQTREHLAILDLLNIPRLVVALTKTDLVDDPEWQELVILDIEDRLGETGFVDVPIVPVSAHTGDGLDDFLNTLSTALSEVEPQQADGIPRLPIDRVFTLSGFGTIVTGTLSNGNLQLGDTVEIMPPGIAGRVRGLQSHNEDVEVAVAGSRVAVNVSGVDKRDINRGDVLTYPDTIHPTTLLDVELTLLPDAPRPLLHNAEVKVFVGPSEVLGRVRLLEDKSLAPGMTTWAQLQLENPLAVVRGQRFIIRFPSPAATIGGGLILDTAPGRKWRRNREDVLARFERLARGTPLDMVSEALIHARQPLSRKAILEKSGLPDTIWDDLEGTAELIPCGQGWLIHTETLDYFSHRIASILQNYHAKNPLQQGMPVGALASRLRVNEKTLMMVLDLLQSEAVIAAEGNSLVKLPDFNVQYTRAQLSAIAKLKAAFTQNPYTPPSVKEATEMLGAVTVLDALIAQGDLVQLGADVLLSTEVYREWIEFSRSRLDNGESLRLGEFRDTFNTSRKYALAFLDHLERYHITRRVDDEHRRGRGDWTQLGV